VITHGGTINQLKANVCRMSFLANIDNLALTGRKKVGQSELRTKLLEMLKKIGQESVTEFLRLQSDGDIGPTLDASDGPMTLSDEAHPLRQTF
jgi:hypothetical protein